MKGCFVKISGFLVILIVLVCLVFWIRYRDISEPDLSALSVERVQVPDDENAYRYFRQAYAESSLEGDREILTRSWDEVEDKNVVVELINRNRKMQELLEVGLAQNFCLVPEVEGLDSDSPYLSEWLNIQSYLRLLADMQISENKLAEASQTLRVLFRFGELTSAHPETLIQYILAMFPKTVAVSKMRHLAVHPEVTSNDLLQMAVALHEAGANEDAAVLALKAEFSLAASVIDSIKLSPLTLSEFSRINTLEEEHDFLEKIPLPRCLFQPNRTKLLFRDTYLSVIQNLQLPYAEMDHSEISYLIHYSGWRSMMRENGLGDLLYMMLLPALDSVLENHIKYEADFASAQLVIALQRYQRDFGLFPDRLNALVPAYLDQLPENPFNGESFQYDPENKALYAEGANIEGLPETVEIFFAFTPGVDPEP